MQATRHLQGSADLIAVTLETGDAPADPAPDTATVAVRRADGTLLVASTAATNAGTGRFTFQLTPTHTALLDRLAADWTFTRDGQVQTVRTYHEIAGGFLFDLSALRADKSLQNATLYPTDKLAIERARAEQSLEDACEVAFVPRYELETLTARGDEFLQLRWHRIRTIRAVTVDGTALTVGELADLQIWDGATVRRDSSWPSGAQVIVGYEHGYDLPPYRADQAAFVLAKNWAIKGPLDDRTTSMSTADGTFSLLTPGVRGAITGFPEVDAVIQQYGRKTYVF